MATCRHLSRVSSPSANGYIRKSRHGVKHSHNKLCRKLFSGFLFVLKKARRRKMHTTRDREDKKRVNKNPKISMTNMAEMAGVS